MRRSWDSLLYLSPPGAGEEIQTRVIARVVCGPGKAGLLFRPSTKSREWRAKRRNRFLSCAPSFRKMRRLSARHGGVLQRPGRAFGGFLPFL
jgi:hypothetical protein